MKRKISLDSQVKNKEYIGSILKAFRETSEQSQRDVAIALGYPNFNFISMIESGRSSPPLGRLKELKDATRANPVIIPVILKYLYPDAWNSMIGALSDCTDIFNCILPSDINERVEAKFLELINDYSSI